MSSCLAVFICRYLGLRRYALATKLMDVPNARSSHSQPTPRGRCCNRSGLPCSVGVDAECRQYLRRLGAMLGAGSGVALLGFLDDHGHIAARWRLLGHFSAAIWILLWTGGFPPLDVVGHAVDLGWLGHVLAVFYLVWVLNLYNFMDGIDGIASVEAIGVCVGALIYWLTGHVAMVGIPLLLACAVAGFLIWNFPPARIFMGDAGSGFLGMVIGALAIQAAWTAPRCSGAG